jgi:hypothetical protein
MKVGFYHPDRGYWQANRRPSENVLASYPEGTVEVSLKPAANYEWQDGGWVYVPPSDADLLASIRTKRDPLLAETDWTQMPDSPLSAEDKAAWAAYRQTLRDITEAEDLSAVVWPDPPA